jgi:hypothetical protein
MAAKEISVKKYVVRLIGEERDRLWSRPHWGGLKLGPGSPQERDDNSNPARSVPVWSGLAMRPPAQEKARTRQ